MKRFVDSASRFEDRFAKCLINMNKQDTVQDLSGGQVSCTDSRALAERTLDRDGILLQILAAK